MLEFRARFLASAAALLCLLAGCSRTAAPQSEQWWQMRGLVLSTKELAEVDWPMLAARSGINTIGTHITPSEVLAFLDTPEGLRFRRECDSLGIVVEHQLHAMGELLPRELFAQDSTMFRMDSTGRRTSDYNCCAHSEAALDIIASNAAELAAALRPANHRYYFWLDDNVPVCNCPLCKDYSPSEQELIIENRMLRAIREVDPEAKLAHLAYSFYMDPPRKVKPDEGIFLEFAPIYRSWDVPLTVLDALCPRGYPVTNGDNLRWLEANLEVFPAEDAVVLEYWVDVSLFSRWKRPAVELPWRADVCRSDLAAYARYGIRNVTSFAVYMDAEYFERFPSTGPIEEYGRLLHSFRHFSGFKDPWRQAGNTGRKGVSGMIEDDTQVSVCCDAEALNILFEVVDSTLTVCEGPDERSVDHGDRVEVFLSCDDKMSRYYGFEVDPGGKVMDYRNEFYRQFDYGWDCGVAAPSVAAEMIPGGYRVELSFPLETLREWGGLMDDGTVHLGLYRADALQPDEIIWYTLVDPRTPEPDFHVPSSLFEIALWRSCISVVPGGIEAPHARQQPRGNTVQRSKYTNCFINIKYNFKKNTIFANIFNVMTKATFSNKLPRQLARDMALTGEQIRLARLRRNLSMDQVAERAQCSIPTLTKVEKGVATVAIGTYLRVLYVLGLNQDILLIAKDDPLGRSLQDLNLPHRERASKK